MKHLRKPNLLFSIKESLDNLPTGIAFFNMDGIPLLCNRKMLSLVFTLTGTDLQHVSELRNALADLPDNASVRRDGDYFILSDGSAWHFTDEIITDRPGSSYIQITAANVTDLCRTTLELALRNGELAAIAEDMERINRNVAAIMREEEILSMKMRIHDRVGSSVLNTQRYLLNGCPPENRQELIGLWRRTLSLLEGSVDQYDETDMLSELIETAHSIGAEIVFDGMLPPDGKTLKLLTAAMRECLTNCIRHAGGDKLYVRLTTTAGKVTAVIMNNGSPPKREISEGGGLSSLRARIEKNGGYMMLVSRPSFELIITLPLDVEDMI